MMFGEPKLMQMSDLDIMCCIQEQSDVRAGNRTK